MAPGGSTSAGDQLKSAAKSDDMSKNFDNAFGGPKSAGHLGPVTIGSRAPVYPKDMGDPRMAGAQHELTKLQSQGDELRAKVGKLTDEMDHAKDAATMKELKAKVDQAQEEYGNNQLDTFKKKEEIEKIHRTIESDRESSPPPGTGGTQDDKPGQ